MEDLSLKVATLERKLSTLIEYNRQLREVLDRSIKSIPAFPGFFLEQESSGQVEENNNH